jgi:hypothetical protein
MAVEQADREGQFLTENGWETAAVMLRPHLGLDR